MNPDTLIIMGGIAVHGLVMLAGGVAFLIRNEHRMTMLEVRVDERLRRKPNVEYR